MTAITLRQPMGFASYESYRNPFVRISPAAQTAVMVYFAIWRIFPLSTELIDALVNVETLEILSLIGKIVVELLLLYPFLRRRFAGSPMGWAHPLILSTLIAIALTILKAPEHLLAPIAFLFAEQSFSHPLLGTWSMDAVHSAQFKMTSITLTSVVATYLGFSIVRFKRIPELQLPPMRGGILAFVFGICVAVTLFFIEKQGGILNHMSSLAGGRFRMRQLAGHYLVLNNFLPYLLILWYLYRPKVLRNPLFLAAFVFAAALQFVVTGSRSGLFTPFAALLVAWMLINYRLPALRSASLGLVAFMMLGALGEVRQSGLDGQVSFEALLDSNPFEQWDKTQSALESQDHGANLAVAAFVPHEVDYLWGRSYMSAAAFWLPRSIWADKPRGIGPHVAALVYGGRTTMEGYHGGGYPISAPMEAYWNFSWLGLFLVFVLYGCLLRFISDWRQWAPDSPIAAMILVLAIFQFSSPSTVSMVSFLQNVVLLAGTVLLAKSKLRT